MPELESLVYSWADRTLTGRGFGVVAHTSGWRWGIRPEAAELAVLLDTASIPRGGAAFAYVPAHPFGPALVLRRDLGADRSGREGRLVAEVHVGGGAPLALPDALAVVAERMPVLDWPIDAAPTPELPPVRGAAAGDGAVTEPSPMRSEHAGAIDALLDCGPRGKSSSIPLSELVRVARMLPTALIADVSFHSGAEGEVVLARTEELRPGAWGARILMTGSFPPVDIATRTALEDWVHGRELAARPLDALTTGELVQTLIVGDRADDAADEYRRREGAGRIPVDVRAVLLGRAAPEIAERIRAGLAVSAADGPLALAAAQAWSVDPHRLQAAADAQLAGVAPGAAVSAIDAAAWTPHVQTFVAGATIPLDRRIAHEWVRTAVVRSWGPGAEALVRAFWTGAPASPSESVAAANGDLLARHPVDVLAVIRSTGVDAAGIERGIRRLPAGTIAQSRAAVAALLAPPVVVASSSASSVSSPGVRRAAAAPSDPSPAVTALPAASSSPVPSRSAGGSAPAPAGPGVRSGTGGALMAAVLGLTALTIVLALGGALSGGAWAWGVIPAVVALGVVAFAAARVRRRR